MLNAIPKKKKEESVFPEASLIYSQVTWQDEPFKKSGLPHEKGGKRTDGCPARDFIHYVRATDVVEYGGLAGECTQCPDQATFQKHLF